MTTADSPAQPKPAVSAKPSASSPKLTHHKTSSTSTIITTTINSPSTATRTNTTKATANATKTTSPSLNANATKASGPLTRAFSSPFRHLSLQKSTPPPLPLVIIKLRLRNIRQTPPKWSSTWSSAISGPAVGCRPMFFNRYGSSSTGRVMVCCGGKSLWLGCG